MNQIVDSLISALGWSRRDQAANDLTTAPRAPMVKLEAADLALIVGGTTTGDDTGPRGGW
jgi:hypothetical protein